MKIFNIQKRKTNKLKRKLNKMVKTLSILNENNLTENQINRIYFINQNIENLQNYIDLLIYELNEKKTNIKENTDIKELKKKDEESQEILDKFLPLMLYYQMVKH
jgi:hypothetical protein